MKRINIVMPMAGEGKRFKEAGYKPNKPFIPTKNIHFPIAFWPIKNVSSLYTKHNCSLFFICRTEDNYGALGLAYSHVPSNDNAFSWCVTTLDKTTEGAASTILTAESNINFNDSLIIINSDQYLENFNPVDFIEFCDSFNADGGVVTFKDTNPKWSFVKTNGLNHITEVAEKNPISDNATVGIYYWKHGSDFVKYANQMIAKNIRVNNEFYVAPVYNEAIADGKIILNYTKPELKMWGLGTPQDLEYFINNYQRNTQ